MNNRLLGSSGIRISTIGLGTNYVGGYGLYHSIDEDEGVRLVQRAIDLGVTFIDTADIYGFGRSEELVGKAIAGKRDQIVLATKGANAFANGERTGVNNRPEYLRSALEASLRRLNTEYVDLYYIHRHDGETPPEDSYGELMRMKEEGLIRAGGVSNFELPELQAAREAGRIDALQSRYNLLQREVEGDILNFCESNDVSFIPWGPIAFGLLGGRYTRDFSLPDGDWRERSGLFDSESYADAMDTVDGLKEVCAAHNIRLPHLAMQWLLAQPSVASVITGAKSVTQVEDNVAASDVTLTKAALAEIMHCVA